MGMRGVALIPGFLFGFTTTTGATAAAQTTATGR
jgi:hypothetical protein